MYSAVSDVINLSQLFDFISLNKKKNIPLPLTEQGKKSLKQSYGKLQLWNRGMIVLITGWNQLIKKLKEH